VYGLNPMVGVVEGVRWALVGTPLGSPAGLVVSGLISGGLLGGGAFYFRRQERTFADVL
jgi:lipopolysaccharide transport system permease protein